MGTRSAGSGNGVREGILTGKCEPGGLACYLDRLIFIFNSGGNVGKPGGQSFSDSPCRSVVGGVDRHHQLSARGHCSRVEGPGSAGRPHRNRRIDGFGVRVRWRGDGGFDRYVGIAANGVVVSVAIPEGTGERVGTRSVRGCNGIREGRNRPLKCEPDLLTRWRDKVRIVGGGNVGKSGGQGLRDSADQSVSGGVDRHGQLAARFDCGRIEGPGSAGPLLLRVRGKQAQNANHTRYRGSRHQRQRFFVQVVSLPVSGL